MSMMAQQITQYFKRLGAFQPFVCCACLVGGLGGCISIAVVTGGPSGTSEAGTGKTGEQCPKGTGRVGGAGHLLIGELLLVVLVLHGNDAGVVVGRGRDRGGRGLVFEAAGK